MLRSKNFWAALFAILFLFALMLNALSGRYVQYQTFSSQGFFVLDTWTGNVELKTSHGVEMPPSVHPPAQDAPIPLKEQ